MDNTTQTARCFETTTCNRCGGTGSYSYCQSYGTTCFKCAGMKVTYTKRGAAASLYLRELRSKAAGQFVVGELFFMDGIPGMTKGGFSKITAVEIITAESLRAKGCIGYTNGVENPVRDQVRIVTEGRGSWQGCADTRQRFGLTAQQKQDTLKLALDYQDTLTKLGTVRKAHKEAK